MNIRLRFFLTVLFAVAGVMFYGAHSSAEEVSVHTIMEADVVEARSGLLTLNPIGSSEVNKEMLEVKVTPETELRMISSLTDLKEGDRVRISYRVDNAKKVATYITKAENQNVQFQQTLTPVADPGVDMPGNDLQENETADIKIKF